MSWKSVEREIKGEIMKTDVYIRVFSETRSVSQMEADVERSFASFRDFEASMSRFRSDSELSALNRAQTFRASHDLFDLLSHAQQYYIGTAGIFDPTVLPTLVQEGYGASFGTDMFGQPVEGPMPRTYTFADITLDEATRMVTKPTQCQLDLGGIGKGFIVDRVARELSTVYTDYIVDAGGDMYVAGRDRLSVFPYFAIAIEDARTQEGSVALLTVSDRAIATSGVNRRRWMHKGKEKSHLIDVTRNASVENDMLAVTVVAETVERADVYAKVLCLLGGEQARVCAEEKQLATFFLFKDGTMEVNRFMQPYIWNEHAV